MKFLKLMTLVPFLPLACLEENPNYCQTHQDCADNLDRTYCDVDGKIENVRNRCLPAPMVQVSVSRAGDGEGSVLSEPLGIDCSTVGARCAASFVALSPVKLTAVSSTASKFSNWSITSCGSELTCVVRPEADLEVVASFVRDVVPPAPTSRRLSVQLTGDGEGVVTSVPDGISCGDLCSASYENGEVVTLIAQPQGSSEFGGWSGPCSGTALTCRIALSADETVGAAFDHQYVSLSVSLLGEGVGRVEAAPGELSCPGDCQESYARGTDVTLTARSSTTSTFEGWGGACSGKDACLVRVDRATSVTATFEPRVELLSVVRSGTGVGTVSSTPSGIDCGDSCEAAYSIGKSVQLVADAAPGSVFTGWSGVCSGRDVCLVTMDESRTVEAEFNLVDVRDFSLGQYHTCAVLSDGSSRCWGANNAAQLGYGHTSTVGDDELPRDVGPIPMGGQVAQIGAGLDFSCAVLVGGNDVRCWGENGRGQLGYGHRNWRGDKTPEDNGDVHVGHVVRQLLVGLQHVCAITQSARVRGWGSNAHSELGPGPPYVVLPTDVLISGALQVAAGHVHSCALLMGGRVRCWGYNASGQLGYGHTMELGDTESPDSLPDIALSGEAIDLAVGYQHTCALLSSGDVQCWGSGRTGQLGYGSIFSVGVINTPDSVGVVPLGGRAVAIQAGTYHTCALLETGHLRCWGANASGQLGYGRTHPIGDNETPADMGDVPLGIGVLRVELGGAHTCALTVDGHLRCWGDNTHGQLGYGHTRNIGDDEPASTAPPVSLF